MEINYHVRVMRFQFFFLIFKIHIWILKKVDISVIQRLQIKIALLLCILKKNIDQTTDKMKPEIITFIL